MPSSIFDLTGRVALVTGAAAGLGRALAVGLAEAGADVIGVYRTRPPTDVQAAVEATGRKFFPLKADLAQPSTMDALATSAIALAGRVDILVNNAGIIRRHDLVDFPEADWDAVMDVNLKSLFLLSQSITRHMMSRPLPTSGARGKIIHIASMLSFQGGIRVASYTAAKHGVLGLTRIMANELAPAGINVNAIAPGYMITDNTEALRADPQRSTAILARIPANRWGDAKDLVGAAVYLASSASDYVHGAVVPVDGGWLAR